MNQSSGSSVQTEIFPPENIRSYTKYTERYTTGIMTFCFVVGTDLDSAFEIKGYAGTSISILKDIIYEKKKNNFKDKGFDPSDLHLWKVDIPGDTENVKLKTLQSRSRDMDKENITIQELGGEKLTPFNDFSDAFKCDSKNIRIIVQPPLPTTTVSPLDESKIEIKNKVTKTFPYINAFSTDKLVDTLALIWHVEALEGDSPGPQNDPCFKLKMEPSFYKINLPCGITKRISKPVDLCLPSYDKSGMNYHNPFYDDPQFIKTVSLVQGKIEENPGDIIVLAGVSGGGKTSTAFGISTRIWSIYVDFDPSGGQYGDFIGQELERIRAKPPKYDEPEEQSKVFDMLDLAIISRGLLLVKLLAQEKISTQKEWLFTQLRMNIGIQKYLHDVHYISSFIDYINECLNVKSLVLIFDEAQVLCGSEYGEYNGSMTVGKRWNLLQAYIQHLTLLPVTCLIAGTYMHMASGISLVTSVGKVQGLHAHIVLKLPFLSQYDVLRNLDAVIDMTDVKPKTCDYLGYLLRGRPRNCASFVLKLILERESKKDRTKDQEMRDLLHSWFIKIESDMARYLENTCKYLGANSLNPETAIIDVLRLRVFYNYKFKQAIDLLQHSVIPCQSPDCIILRHEDTFYNEIKINPSLESYLVSGIEAFLKKRGKILVDVFVDNIIRLNDISSIGNEFDAVFITAIIQKRGRKLREELEKWKNGQQFTLPSWITPTMRFLTNSNLSRGVPIAKYVDNATYYRSYAIQPDRFSGSDVVISLGDEQNVILLSASCTISGKPIKRSKIKEQLFKSCMKFQYMEKPRKRKISQIENHGEFSWKKSECLQIGFGELLPVNEEDNLEEEEGEYEQDLDYDLNYDLNYDLDYTNNTMNYRISKVPEYAKNHEKIKTSTKDQKHIYVSVELPHRASKRSELFRLNEYGDLVIIVDDRNMEHVFGPVIKKLVESLRQRCENQENSMDQTE